MRINSYALLFGVLPITSHALRGADHQPRRLKQTVASSCTFVVAKALAIDPDNAPTDETSFGKCFFTDAVRMYAHTNILGMIQYILHHISLFLFTILPYTQCRMRDGLT